MASCLITLPKQYPISPALVTEGLKFKEVMKGTFFFPYYTPLTLLQIELVLKHL